MKWENINASDGSIRFSFLYITYMGFEYQVLTLQKMIDYNIPSFSKTW